MTNFAFIVCFLLTTLFIYVTIIGISTVYLFIELKSMQKSTHQLEYVPFDPKWASSEEKLKEFEENMAAEQPMADQDDLDESELDLKKLI